MYSFSDRESQVVGMNELCEGLKLAHIKYTISTKHSPFLAVERTR